MREKQPTIIFRHLLHGGIAEQPARMHMPPIIHVTSLEGEDHWSVHTQAKALVPRKEDRHAARSLMAGRDMWHGAKVLWWHPMYFEEARRTQPPFPAAKTRNLVLFHHDRLTTAASADVHGAMAVSAAAETVLREIATAPVFRVHSGGAEDARPHYEPASRVTPTNKVWLGIIGGGGSPMQTAEGPRRVRKGQDLLVPLAKRLSPSKYGWTFIGPHWGPWCEELRALGFEVFAPGYTAPGGQYVHFREVDVYLMISRLEGNPLPLLEAMGCGIWSIAAPTGIVPEIVDDGVNGTLLEGWDVGEIHDAIMAINREFLNAHRSQVAESVAAWTWERFAGEVRNAMRCVFGELQDARVFREELMTSLPHVSISLSTYNEGPFVTRTVAALLDGTAYPDFDILVHDDGSTDGSCELLPKDSRLRVLRSESRHGVAGGKRLAAEASDGPLLLNMDCHVAPRDSHWLRSLVDALQVLEYRAVVSPVSVPLDAVAWQLKLAKAPVLTRLRNTFHVSWWQELGEAASWIEVSALRGIAKLMTREVYNAIGGFDAALTYGGEESDVSIRAWMTGFVCAYVPASVIGHVFKRKSQFPRSYAEETVKRLRVAFKCLSDSGYEKVLKHNQDFLEGAGAWGPGVFASVCAQLQNELASVISLRDELRKRSAHPGEWVFERFGIPL